MIYLPMALLPSLPACGFLRSPDSGTAILISGKKLFVERQLGKNLYMEKSRKTGRYCAVNSH